MEKLGLNTQHTNRCYMLIGLPGSGKSHWADTVMSRWKEAAKPAIICEDDLVHQECERTGEPFNTVADRLLSGENKIELKKRFNAAIGVSRNIIIDAHNLTEEERAVYLLALPDHYQKIGIIFKAPNGVLLERLQKRADETGRYVPSTTLGILGKRYQHPGKFEFLRTTMIDHTCSYL